jgi:hypothetical protein
LSELQYSLATALIRWEKQDLLELIKCDVSTSLGFVDGLLFPSRTSDCQQAEKSLQGLLRGEREDRIGEPPPTPPSGSPIVRVVTLLSGNPGQFKTVVKCRQAALPD